MPVNRIAPSDFGQVVISNIEESPTRRGLVDDRNPSLLLHWSGANTL